MTEPKKSKTGKVILGIIILAVVVLIVFTVLKMKNPAASGSAFGPGGGPAGISQTGAPGAPGAAGTASGAPGAGSAPGAAGNGPAAGAQAGAQSGAPAGFPFGGAAASQKTVLAVKTATAERGAVTTYIRINGDVVPRTKVNIYPDTSGKLISLAVRVGDSVSRGQTLGSIDPSKPGENYAASPIFASVSGSVISLPIEPGEKVTSSTAVVVVGDLSRLRIETSVAERYVGSLRIGLPALLSFESYPGETFAAHVVEISPVLDSGSRTNPISLELDSPASKIKAGMYASIRLITRESRGTIRIPREAVIISNSGTSVFVVDDSSAAHRRTIELGLQGEDMVEVVSGLEPGEIVVTQGQTLLSEGSPVHIVE